MTSVIAIDLRNDFAKSKLQQTDIYISLTELLTVIELIVDNSFKLTIL